MALIVQLLESASIGASTPTPATITLATGLPGPQGLPGEAATIEVGSTSTLTPGSPATVTNSGTSSAAIFNFGIPQGQQGQQGPSGVVYATAPLAYNSGTQTISIDLSAYLTTSAAASIYYPQTNPAGYITSSALSGYATQSWVTSQGYLTSSSLTGYATQSWVYSQGYITSAAAASTYYPNYNPSGFIGDAPSDGSEYARKDGAWSVVTGGGSAVWGSITGTITDQTDLTSYVTGQGYLTDAPNNSLTYGRSAGSWISIPSAASQLTTGTYTTNPGSAPTTNQVLSFNGTSLVWALPYVNIAWGSITGTITDQTDLTSYLTSNFYPISSNPAGYITDATADGKLYARQDYGWTSFVPGDRYLTASTTSLTIGNGSKSLTVGTGLSYSATQDVTIAFDTAPTFYHMHGTVTSYDSGTGALVVDVQNHTGSGTFSAWTVNVGGLAPATSIVWGDITGTLSNQTDLQSALDLKAPKASPTFTGTPLSTTAAADTNSTQIATTAFVVGQASSTTPAADGTAAVGTSLKYARADHVHANPLPTGGTAGQVLSKVDGTNFNVTWTTAGGGGCNVQTFGSSSSSGTFSGSSGWQKPAGAKWVEIILYGGGGGGGSGARQLTSTARFGGGGGGAGTMFYGRISADYLASQETVVIGSGGTGGASITSGSANGNPGNAGSNTTFSLFKAVGGNLGSAGTTTTGTAGGTRTSLFFASTVALGSGGNGASANGSTANAISSINALPTGGGGGGGAAGGSTAGAFGGDGGSFNTSTNNAGIISVVAGGPGGNPSGSVAANAGTSATTQNFVGGTGGGGGFYATGVGNGTNNAGAAGGWPGGAGGGGGAADNSTGVSSGAGGTGAHGYAVIITYT